MENCYNRIRGFCARNQGNKHICRIRTDADPFLLQSRPVGYAKTDYRGKYENTMEKNSGSAFCCGAAAYSGNPYSAADYDRECCVADDHK